MGTEFHDAILKCNLYVKIKVECWFESELKVELDTYKIFLMCQLKVATGKHVITWFYT